MPRAWCSLRAGWRGGPQLITVVTYASITPRVWGSFNDQVQKVKRDDACSQKRVQRTIRRDI
jgi:hypothetical protein